MNSRRKTLVYALAAGIAAGLFTGAILARRERKIPPPPPLPLTLPENVEWANRTHIHREDGTESTLLEGFVADGKKFRLEVAIEGKPPVVWVYDGKDLAVNMTVLPKTSSQLDPRNTILAAYETFPTFQYLGLKTVGEHECWAFEKKTPGIHSRLWVDTKTNVPRQIIIEYPDGRKDSQIYTDLPVYRTHQPGLFDSAHLEAMLMPGAEAMLGE